MPDPVPKIGTVGQMNFDCNKKNRYGNRTEHGEAEHEWRNAYIRETSGPSNTYSIQPQLFEFENGIKNG